MDDTSVESLVIKEALIYPDGPMTFFDHLTQSARRDDMPIPLFYCPDHLVFYDSYQGQIYDIL